jgi:hypothetical protein
LQTTFVDVVKGLKISVAGQYRVNIFSKGTFSTDSFCKYGLRNGLLTDLVKWGTNLRWLLEALLGWVD